MKKLITGFRGDRTVFGRPLELIDAHDEARLLTRQDTIAVHIQLVERQLGPRSGGSFPPLRRPTAVVSPAAFKSTPAVIREARVLRWRTIVFARTLVAVSRVPATRTTRRRRRWGTVVAEPFIVPVLPRWWTKAIRTTTSAEVLARRGRRV
jgi:hypothetical protein